MEKIVSQKLGKVIEIDEDQIHKHYGSQSFFGTPKITIRYIVSRMFKNKLPRTTRCQVPSRQSSGNFHIIYFGSCR